MASWDFKQYNNYEASVVKRSTGENFRLHRFTSDKYTRLIITKELVGGITRGNPSDLDWGIKEGQENDINLEELNLESLEDMGFEGEDISDILRDIDLPENTKITENDMINMDLDGLMLDLESKEKGNHSDPYDNPIDNIIDGDITGNLEILNNNKSKPKSAEEISPLGRHILDKNSDIAFEDRIENVLADDDDIIDVDDGTLLGTISSFSDANIQYITPPKNQKKPNYKGHPVIYDQLTTNFTEDKYVVVDKYDYGDVNLANRLVDLCNRTVQAQPKRESDVTSTFVWEQTGLATRTLGSTQELKFLLDGNIEIKELIDIHGSMLGKTYEDDNYIIEVEFKRLTSFTMRDKPLDGLPYRKTTTSKLKVNKKYLGEEHKILRFPPIDYFKSFLNLNYIEKCNYKIIDDEVELKAIARLLRSADPDHVFGYDAETTGLRFHRRISPDKKDVLVTHSLSWEDNQSIIVPIRMRNRKNISTEVFNYHMQEILETRRILAHNGGADVRFLIEEGIDLNLSEDTFHLAKHLMPYIRVDEEGTQNKSRSNVTRRLDDLVYRTFGVNLIDLNKYVFKPAGISFDFSRLDDSYMIYYGCPDTDRMRMMWKVLRPKLEDRQEVAYRATVKFAKVNAIKSTYEGIRLSEEIVIDSRKKAHETMEYLEELALELAGETKETLNIGSSKQLANYIYGKMGVEVTDKTKRTSGNELSADKYVMESLASVKLTQPTDTFKEDILSADGDVIFKKEDLNSLAYPFCAIVRKYADIKKDITAYYDGLLNKSIDGLYHPDPRIGATATWRTTERTQITKAKIKSGLTVYDDEHYFVSLDFSAEELRLAVNQSDDYGFMDILDDPEADPHTSAAAELWRIKQYMVNKELRDKAKGCNFGIIYGMRETRLTKNINKTEHPTQEQLEDGRRLYAQYNYTYSRMISALQPAKDKVQRDGYLYNNLGYKMIYDDVLDLEDYEDQIFCTERLYPPTIRLDPIRMQEYGGSLLNKSGNYPIQSWAAGLLMLFLIAFYEALEKYGIQDKVAIPLTVHDEVDLIVHQSVDPYLMLKILVEVFELKMDYLKKRTVPLYVGIGFGHSWGEAKLDDREIPVNLQHKLIEEYDKGLTPKNLLAVDIPKHFKGIIDTYIRQRIRDLVPDMMESKTYLTGQMIDVLRENIFLLKKGAELFGFYNNKTDEYHHDKILEVLCEDTELSPIDFTVIVTQPTEEKELPEDEKVIDFFFQPLVHPNVMVVGENMTVECTGLKQSVVKNLLTYLLQFNDLKHDKSKKLILKIGSSMNEVPDVKLLGLPMTARDDLTNIFAGGKPRLIRDKVNMLDPNIIITDVYKKSSNKITLDISVFDQQIQAVKLKQILEFLKPWLVTTNITSDRELEIYNGEITPTGFKIRELSMDDLSKLYDIIQAPVTQKQTS